MSHAWSPDIGMTSGKEASTPPPGMTSLSSMWPGEVEEGKLEFGVESSSAMSRRGEVVPFEMGDSAVQHGIIYRCHMTG
jgi:hypothetical protein